MKSMIMVLLLAVAWAVPAWGQASGDSSITKFDSLAQHGRRFVDENGDGIDDWVQGKGRGVKRGKDKFIDRDGDGICDGRESGLGVRGGNGVGGSGKVEGNKWRGGRR